LKAARFAQAVRNRLAAGPAIDQAGSDPVAILMRFVEGPRCRVCVCSDGNKNACSVMLKTRIQGGSGTRAEPRVQKPFILEEKSGFAEKSAGQDGQGLQKIMAASLGCGSNQWPALVD